MRNTILKTGTTFLVLALFIFILASCQSVTTSTTTITTTEIKTTTTTTQSILITDQMDRVITLPANPQRIVSLAPSNTEILFAMGLGDQVVGRTDYCNYPPEALKIPSIGGFSTPNLEEVVALEPDLVVAASIHEEIVTQLDKKEIPVLVLDPTTINEILESFELVGQVTDARAKAAALRQEMESRIGEVTGKTVGLAAGERVRACFVVWHDPLMIAGGDTMYNELIELAGGTNIVSKLSGYPSVELETMLVENPQVLIVGVGMGDGEDLPYQYLIEESLLEGIDARKNNRIYSIDQDIVGRFGPRIIDAIEQFAIFLHPELFD